MHKIIYKHGNIGLDGRIKAEPNPVNLTMLGLNPSGTYFSFALRCHSCEEHIMVRTTNMKNEPFPCIFAGGETGTKSNSEIRQWDSRPTFDSQWPNFSKIKTYLDSVFT